MRLVLDTDVMVAALRSPRGGSGELLRRALSGRHLLLVTHSLMTEYEAVLTRSEHLAAASASMADAQRFLDVVAALAEPVHIHYRWRGFLPDPGDDLVLEAAINGGAEAIVTFNRRHFGPAANFGLNVFAPKQALERD